MKKIFLTTLLILFLIFIGCASASEDINLTNDWPIGETQESSVIGDNTLFNTNDIEIVVNEEAYINSHENKEDEFAKDWYRDSAYVALPTDANGTVTFKVNNTPYKTFDVVNDSEMDVWFKQKKVVYCYFEDLKAGNYDINVTYTGNYGTLTKTSPINIVNVLIVIDKDISYDNYDYLIDLNEPWYEDNAYLILPRDANGTITIKVNNSTYKTFDVVKNSENSSQPYPGQKIVYYYFKNLKLGKYTIEVTYNGNYGTYTKIENTTLDYKFYFERNALSTNKDYPVDRVVFFILPYDIKGNVKAYIDGVDVHYDIAKIIPATVSRPANFYHGTDYYYAPIWINEQSLSKGYHTLEVKYLGDAKYPGKSIKTEIYVGKSQLGIESKQLLGTTTPVKFLFNKNTKGTFSIYTSTDKKKYKLLKRVEIKNNKATINVPFSKIGKLYIKASYKTNLGKKEIYKTVNVVPTILKYNEWTEKGLYMYEKDSDTFYLNCGKKVTGTFSIYLNNKLYKSVKIKNKSVKITVPSSKYNKKEGKYIIKAIWKTNYGTGSKTMPPIYVIDGTKLVVAEQEQYNKNVPIYDWEGPIKMYYGDPLEYSLEVYGKNNKPVGKNKIVTFTIGKQIFKVKTDKNSIATIKISNKITPGTYKIKATYLKESKTKKLVVKEVLSLKYVKVKKSNQKIMLEATLKNKNPLENKQITFKFNEKTYKAKTNSKGIANITINKSTLSKLKVGKKITYQATYMKDTVKKTVKVLK